MERNDRASKVKKTLQLPLAPSEYQSISDQADSSGLSMPEIVRQRLRTGAEAEAEMGKIIDKILAFENAGFVLTYRAVNGESFDLKPLSLMLLPYTTRIPKRDGSS